MPPLVLIFEVHYQLRFGVFGDCTFTAENKYLVCYFIGKQRLLRVFKPSERTTFSS